MKTIKREKYCLEPRFSDISLYENHLENLLTLVILDLTLSPPFEEYLAGAEKVLVVSLPQRALKCLIKTKADLFQ